MRSAFACFSSAFTQFDLHCKSVSGGVENELSSFVARSSAEGAATCTVSTPIFQPPSEQPIQQVMSEPKMPEATNDAENLPKFYMDKKEFSVEAAVVNVTADISGFIGNEIRRNPLRKQLSPNFKLLAAFDLLLKFM